MMRREVKDKMRKSRMQDLPPHNLHHGTRSLGRWYSDFHQRKRALSTNQVVYQDVGSNPGIGKHFYFSMTRFIHDTCPPPFQRQNCVCVIFGKLKHTTLTFFLTEIIIKNQLHCSTDLGSLLNLFLNEMCFTERAIVPKRPVIAY